MFTRSSRDLPLKRAVAAVLGCALVAVACGETADEGEATDGGAAAAGTAGSASEGGAGSGAAGATGGVSGTGNAGVAGTPVDGGSAAGGAAGGGNAGGSATGGVAGNAGGSTGGAAGATGGNGAGEGGEGDGDPIVGLSWPVDCVPGEDCVNLGYPDVDGDGVAFDCGDPGYQSHEGTDIGITFAAQAAGTDVWAAADGVVLFVFDGKYDECPSATEPDCQDPPGYEAGATVGNTVCTPLGPYCGTGTGSCFWCFAGGNVVVIRHSDVPGVFATRYDHLKRNSITVSPGNVVARGQKIAEAASAGNSTGPHLHFEVWGAEFYDPVDPWAGACGPNQGPSLWAADPPWSG